MELRGGASGDRGLSNVEMQFHSSFRSKRLCLFACTEKKKYNSVIIVCHFSLILVCDAKYFAVM